MLQAFQMADSVLLHGIQGISSLITQRGLINVDFADVKAIMSQAGSALMAIGVGSGDNRMIDAVNEAIASPLLEVNIDGAKGVLFNVTGGEDMGILEVYEAADIVAKAVDPEANIIVGAVIDPTFATGEVQITLIATGFDLSKPNVHRSRSFPSGTQQTQGQPVQPERQQPERQQPERQQPERQQPERQQPQRPPLRANPGFGSGEDLDIPPFLRNRNRRNQ
jgi:cell division protein FtsZ